MGSILKEAQQEVCRLASNNKALFDILPDFLIILRDDCTIERMNAAAISKFGDLTQEKCSDIIFGKVGLCDALACPHKHCEDSRKFGEIAELQIYDDLYVEYTYVPFEGYHGHNLILFVMRDISKRKQNELELAKYQNNIELVLQEKIAVLNESMKVREQLTQEVNILKKEIERIANPDIMVGESKTLGNLREMIYQVADSDVTILITGESGTGKELVADMVHKNSSRVGKPFLKFNCSAVSESLLESDLFGYEKGAFTGATSCRKGKFEIVDGGTIFLDEVGDISPNMQAALLRVLENGEIVRVGGASTVRVDVRVIAATNVDLVEAVNKGKFRQDLYYRLNVIALHQSPLRERKEDIVALATHFLKKYRDVFKKKIDFLPDNVISTLLLYDWPGNIRELQNVMQRAVLYSRGNMITAADIDFGITGIKTYPKAEDTKVEDDVVLDQPLKESVAAFEKKVIGAAFVKCKGKAHDVANMLGLGKTALYEKNKRYQINPKTYR
ncbi:MAG: sigma-54 dependent transcriptional regulator [Thermodesulfobacteriota bacterium]